MATGPGMGSGCTRVGNDVRIGYLLSMTLVAEPIEMPRVRVRRFRACHRKRALWKKSRVDRIVGGDPVNGVDRDGRWFGVDDAIAIGIGAIAGGVTACMRGHCSATDGKFWAYVGGGAAIGEAALYTGGAAAGLVAGAGGGAVATGVAAGVAGGAVAGAGNYTLGSGVETGFSNFSGSGLWNATWTSAVAGGVGGGVGGYMSTAGWNLLGRGGAALSAGFSGGFTGGLLNGQSVGDAAVSGLIGAGVAYGVDGASFYAHKHFDPAYASRFSGSSLSTDGGLSVGDRIVMAPDPNEAIDPQQLLSHEDYTHAGVVDMDADGNIVLREANINHNQSMGGQLMGGGFSEQQTNLSHFDGRSYTNLGAGKYLMPYNNQPLGYMLPSNNCTTQSSFWTGGSFVNNPGVWARRMSYGLN